ncbi:MAG: EAL domain-containing protein [Bradyrhizobium sp.]|uniref:EAL domain-containing protein n=1 Tax=Bradyrhizobium sp. TaxID=376 RepID=UPI0025BC9DD0|nr:EAL domain-containing protein [Bradyrhizobium sp.]MBI5264165.1 EAL domain-containing protein [Bradyrhizobium sp.]
MSADDCPVVELSEVLPAALEQADQGVVIVDGDHRVAGFNSAAERIWELDRAAVLGCDAGRLGLKHLSAPAEGGPACGENCAEVRRYEIAIPHTHGGNTRAEVSVSYVESAGKTTHVAFVRDITTQVEQRERIELLTSVADKTSRAIVVADPDLKIRYANAAFAALLGYSLEEVRGRSATALLAGPCTDRKAIARVRRHLRKRESGEVDLLVYSKDGEEIWASLTLGVSRDDNGQTRHVFALLSDISETRQLWSLQQLIMSALADEVPITQIAGRLCSRVEEIAPDVVCSLLHVDADGLLHPLGSPSLPEEYSRALDGVAIGPDIGSCGSAAFYGKPVLAMDIDADPRWQPYKAMPLQVGLRACWSTPIKARDGRVIATFAFYFRECRAPSRWHRRIVEACVQLGALAIERKEARAEIARLAYHDTLTGLPNRAQLRHLIAAAIETCPVGSHVALAFLDVDHFKDVNDTLGHAAGDEVLVELAERLRAQIQPEHMLGRLGGDEFVVLLPDCDAEGALRIITRITQALASPLRIGTRQVPMSASIGISLYPDNATDMDTLMQQADAAMYKAKEAGRCTYVLFSPDMNGVAEQRLILSAALRRAISEGALSLCYQPQIRTIDGTVYGVEALARWRDPMLGEVSPAKFIPLAEEFGLIERIGLWSLREACRQMAHWRRAGLNIPSVSVNLSPINFQNVGLAKLVSGVLAEHGLPPDALMLEITEGAIMQERSVALESMKAIRELGVGLSLDDFGTGYSSLSRLAHLPIGELKIDRSFMRNIESDASALAIAKAVVRVGQSLNMTVVAEGVETDGQRDVLAGLGCDVVQGFLYARPLDPVAFEHWLIDHGADQAKAVLGRMGRASSGKSASKARRSA